jgi:hypothetical protein
MTLTITMKLDNEAFGDDDFSRGQEAADQLKRIAENLVEYGAVSMNDRPIHDANGNRVGKVTVK